MKIVLVGRDYAPHLGKTFKEALRGLGHSVRMVEERWSYTVLDRRPLRPLKQRVFGARPSGRALFRFLLLRECERFKPDLVLVVKGGAMDIELIEEVRAITQAPLAMYSTDNPFNPAVLSQHNIDALAHWDIIATPRRDNIPELKKYCLGDVFYLPFGYDPASHYPEKATTEREVRKYRSDVTFVGNCDPDRVPYLDLIARTEDLTVTLYGGYHVFTPAIKKRARGYAVGRVYRLVLGNAGVALSLVRRANGDSHVMRTYEIPACGAFMLAERTADHEEMFEEDREAVFFSSPEELLDKAKFYLCDISSRQRIAAAGYRRATETPNTYADRMACLLERVR